MEGAHRAAVKKTRVLMLIGTLDVGGTEMMVKSLATGLDRRRFDVTVMCLAKGGRVAEMLKREGIRVDVLGISSKMDVTSVYRLARFLKQMRFDIVHSFLFYSNVLARISGRLANTPAIVSGERSTSEWKSPLYRLIDRLTSVYSTVIVANSNAVRDSLVEDVRIKPDRIRVVYNGIDLRRFDDTADSRKVREQLSLSEKKVTVVTVTRLHPEKNPSDFIKAASIVKRKHGNVQFLVVGDGRLMGELKIMSSELGISDDVIFAGEREDVPGLLKASDIFVLTSLWEGLPVSVLEAMASSLPVVATDVGGTKEVIDNGVTGILVPRENPEELAAAIGTLIENPERRKQMGFRGRERVEEYFTLKGMIENMEALYEHLRKPDR
ncbi:MAG: glycosyltransferase [Candidatus Altiarchaeota archaeon]